jgi:hypothetical protein
LRRRGGSWCTRTASLSPTGTHTTQVQPRQGLLNRRRKPNSVPCPEMCPALVPMTTGQNRGPEKRREEKKEKQSKSAEHPGFPSWYALYPLKKSRVHAATAYAKAIKLLEAEHGDEACEFLNERTQALVPELLSKAPFIPHPATWLNAQRWDDQPMPSAMASKVATAEDLANWRPT